VILSHALLLLCALTPPLSTDKRRAERERASNRVHSIFFFLKFSFFLHSIGESETSEETSESGENNNENDFSTFRIRKDVVAEQPTGKVTNEGGHNSESTTAQRKKRPTKKKATIATPQFVYRPPEEWEINIIALERGEWIPNMSEEAFRKYKKERPKLKDATWFLIEEKVEETNTSSNSSSTTTPTSAFSSSTTIPFSNTSNNNTNTFTQMSNKPKRKGSSPLSLFKFLF
jgi:hypothetical protein